LRPGDSEAILEAIAKTRFVDDPTRFPAVALEAIDRLVSCDVASFNDIDPATGRLVVLLHPPGYFIPAEYAAALARLADEHPLIRHHQQTGDGSAVKFTDFVQPRELHELSVYREVYGPLGIEHQIAITLPAARPRIVGIALNRRAHDFDERERAILNTLRPHLAQSYSFAEERDRLRAGLVALTHVLREGGSHVVTLEQGREEVSVDAADLLSSYFGPLSGKTALPREMSQWLETQQNLEASGLGLLPALTRKRGTKMLVARYIPSIHGAGTIVLNERPTTLDTDELARLGLTNREAEIMQQLVRGASDNEIAASLHIAYGTVRKHLDNIYRKLGANRRTQAIATALELLPAEVDERPRLKDLENAG